jgi:adenosine deaminase CECR1
MSKKSLAVFSLTLIFIEYASARFIIEMDTSSCSRPTFNKYEEIRRDFMGKHLSRALGYDIELNEDEEKLNAIIMSLKRDELSRGFQNPFNFTPARHFFEVKKYVESSPLFKIIQKMPKGLYVQSSSHVMSLMIFSLFFSRRCFTCP